MRYLSLVCLFFTQLSVGIEVHAQTQTKADPSTLINPDPYQNLVVVPGSPRLGVYCTIGYITYPGFNEPAIYITSVIPGSAAYGRLDPGDMITRVNGVRVRTVEEFQIEVAKSIGSIQLRLRDVRTGQIQDTIPIPISGPQFIPPLPVPVSNSYNGFQQP
jgi:PDZ domain-containing secreted protein